VGEISIIGLDIAKQVFHAHGADAKGATVFSRRITRQKLIGSFASAAAVHHAWGLLAARPRAGMQPQQRALALAPPKAICAA
jgi:hypothetical protein